MRSGDWIEIIVLDEEKAERGSLLCEVLGQGVDEVLDVGIQYVYPMAALEPALMHWAVPNLAAPGGVHLCEGDARDLDLSDSEAYLLGVDSRRLRD